MQINLEDIDNKGADERNKGCIFKREAEEGVRVLMRPS